jgi:hypothetical protein
MTDWRAAVLALALASGAPAPAGAASIDQVCGRLFLPEGYQLDCSVQGGTPAAERAAVVRPVEGAFAPLSELTIRALDQPVKNPEQWLRDQLKLDLSGVEDSMSALVQSPDSPFAGTPLAEEMRSWTAFLNQLTALPLEGCREPATLPAGEGWELACEWPFGPLRQFLTLRLVERDGQQYAVRIRTMNERRLRHLVAIANSF